MVQSLDLNLTWFILIGVLLTGYAMLDGFDFGVGALHLFTKSDEDRRVMLNAIGPVWDGNEVWLVTGGGALFAAFPDVYATVFSGFYLPFMLLLVCLIFRAVAIEFRSKQSMRWWRSLWDASFSLASILASLLIGVALGNIAWGIPLGADKEYAGGVMTLIHPYSVLVGVLTLALFMMHGSIFVLMKTQGRLHDQARVWTKYTMIFFIVTFVITTLATLLYVPHMSDTIKRYPILFVVPMLGTFAIANIPRCISKGKDFQAFLSSCLSILLLMTIFGLDMYPNLVYSNPDPAYSLTLYNAASSQKTLGIMLLIAVFGVPLVLAYTASIYWIFRGKVRLEAHSY